MRVEKRANQCDKMKMLFSKTETAKQNQKFPFHFFFRFAAEGWGEETREKCKEIFWFLHTRVRERVRGAHHWSSGFNSKYIRTSFNTLRRGIIKLVRGRRKTARPATVIVVAMKSRLLGCQQSRQRRGKDLMGSNPTPRSYTGFTF